MNPELLRNLWLELTPRRVAQMAGVLALILLTVNVSPITQLGTAAEYLFYGIVVLWGTREAAQAVVGEIRERTWDFQRLSALTPFEMTLGKLLGATSYVWFGGFICLSFLLAEEIRAGSPRILQSLFYFLALGLLSQAVALFASLIAVRRRQTRTAFNVFQYQAAGLLAAYVAVQRWREVSAGRAVSDVVWWGIAIDGAAFFLVSLGLFLAWALIGCYRLMRLELQVESRPTVWLAFCLFIAAYLAGFETISLFGLVVPTVDLSSLRVAIATAALACLTYIAILFEPKDPVLYRWLGEMLAKGRHGAVMSRLQCWMIAYAAAMIGALATVFLNVEGVLAQAISPVPLVIAAMGFLTRDLGIFLFFGLAPGSKRGDMPAMVTLAVLYLLLPVFLNAVGAVQAGAAFYPLPSAGWLGTIYAWVEAVLMWLLVITVRSRQTAALPSN
jgi:hypothetical protein